MARLQIYMRTKKSFKTKGEKIPQKGTKMNNFKVTLGIKKKVSWLVSYSKIFEIKNSFFLRVFILFYTADPDDILNLLLFMCLLKLP